MFKNTLLKILTLVTGLAISMSAFSAPADSPLPETFAEHKIVLQISDFHPGKQTLVLNVAGNLLKHYAGQEVDMEIVSFGPGARLMFDGNINDTRIQTLMDAGVRFSVCGNTITNMAKKLGHEPEIRDGITRVKAGAARILQLNTAGWKLLKP